MIISDAPSPGFCDICRSHKQRVRSYSDQRSFAGICVCSECLLNVVLYYSPCRASEAPLCELLSRHVGQIRLVVSVSQLPGGTLRRLYRGWQLYRRLDPEFFWYKVRDGLGGGGVARRAKQLGIPVLRTTSLSNKHFLQRIRSSEFDLGLAVFANQIFPWNLLRCHQQGVLNVHGSLLPHYRGAAQYYWYLKNHDTRGGITIHCMNEALDAGNILYQEPFAIMPSDTMHTLHRYIAKRGCELLSAQLHALQKGTPPVPVCQPFCDEQLLPLPPRAVR